MPRVNVCIVFSKMVSRPVMRAGLMSDR